MSNVLAHRQNFINLSKCRDRFWALGVGIMSAMIASSEESGKTLQPERPTLGQVGLASVTALLTIGMSYPWGYTLINGMLVGQPNGRMLAIFVAVLFIVMFLATILSLLPPLQPYRWRIGWISLLLFSAANGVMVYFRVVSEPPMFVVIVLYVLGNLWVVWLALFPIWPIRFSWRVALLLLLIGTQVTFTRLFRIEGLTGDANVDLAWRHSPGIEGASSALRPETARSSVFEPVTWLESPNDFPQFLGPDRTGVIRGPRLARHWTSSPPETLWRKPVGAGWGAFAVVGDFAVTQEQRGDAEAVVCYELKTGRECWIHSDPGNFDSSLGGPGPRATPTIRQGRIYSVGPTGLLNCLDGANGKQIWSARILENPATDNISHGVCGSPLVLDDKVIVSPCGPEGVSLAAYSLADGAPLWRKGQPGIRASYASPMAVEIGGTQQILLFNGHGVAGHDAGTGEVLWSVPWENNVNVNCSQPILLPGTPDRVFVSTGYGTGSKLFTVEKTSEGQWITRDVWRSRGLKCKFTSPVIVGDFAYGLDDGILACLDLKTGKQTWKRGRYGHGQILLVGDLLLVLTEKGEMVLVEPKPEKLDELGSFPALTGKTWNTIALSGNRLLVRNDHEAACFHLPVDAD